MENKSNATVRVYNGKDSIDLVQVTPWECVIKVGQTFFCDSEEDKGMYEVLKVDPSSKFDSQVTLMKKIDAYRKSMSASSLCSNPFWRRLPDLELDEVYLSDDIDPFDAPTRIGLGPATTLLR